MNRGAATCSACSTHLLWAECSFPCAVPFTGMNRSSVLELMIVRLMLTVTVNYNQEKVLLPLLSIDIGSWQF
jgi:hypothetical protein